MLCNNFAINLSSYLAFQRPYKNLVMEITKYSFTTLLQATDIFLMTVGHEKEMQICGNVEPYAVGTFSTASLCERRVREDEKIDKSRSILFNTRFIQNGTRILTLNRTSDVVELQATPVYKHIKEENAVLGLGAVVAICIFSVCLTVASGFAGVYLEKILKQKKEVSVCIRNIQLCIISIPASLLLVFVSVNSKFFQFYFDRIKNVILSGDRENIACDGNDVAERGFFIGFDYLVWITIFLTAFGGLMVATVIKYTDNILKTFAASFAVIVSCIISAVIFRFQPTILFIVGGTIVILAVSIYNLFPHKKNKKLAEQAPIVFKQCNYTTYFIVTRIRIFLQLLNKASKPASNNLRAVVLFTILNGKYDTLSGAALILKASTTALSKKRNCRDPSVEKFQLRRASKNQSP
ncbi:unnamed protein product [Enterobius vermicularis]|uniref:G_PROTEIN_RECEP_F3_4 domain-containing protein n=1 Tax=Enterobius vermicularis TaxID=51028 RepID=A0A0N4VAF2_ENTVE|nr:unnamed protein product [Enterobius vermicularis]